MKLLASVVASTTAIQSENLCPSYVKDDGCYEQVGVWAQNGEPGAIRCQMSNPQCLEVTCDYDRIKAEFRGDLFDNNPGQTSFLDQIGAGQRKVLDKSGVPLVPGDCYFTVANGKLNIDWSYEKCSQLMEVDLVNDEVIYKVKLSVKGDDNDGNDTIEFYVDHKFGADCKYPAKITLDDSFWVNQEDVKAHKNASGEFESEFTCDFYSNSARTKRINSDNIVNMGDTIYGQVTSKSLFGLSYELTQVSVTDAKDDTLTFNVIENGESVDAVSSIVEDRQVTGDPLNFNWMSFGFQGLANQNKLEIQCQVELRLNGQVKCPTGYELLSLSGGDVCAQFNYGKFKWETAKNACHEDNAELALPTNEEDNKIFSDKVGYGRYDLWIGAEFEPAPILFSWTNDAVENNGVLTASSSFPWAWGYNGEWLTVDKITDGNPETFWHSDLNDNPSKVTYALNTPQTITQVTVGRRVGPLHVGAEDRYNNMVVTLEGSDGTILARESTTGDSGEPFLNEDGTEIIVPFDSIDDVAVITISFEDGEVGQIMSLVVEGVVTHCWEWFRISGNDETNGKYVLQDGKVNGEVYYKRNGPAPMFAYKAPYSDNWFFSPYLGENRSVMLSPSLATGGCPHQGPYKTKNPRNGELVVNSDIKSRGKPNGVWLNTNDQSALSWTNWNTIGSTEPNNAKGNEFFAHIILTDGQADGYEKKNGKWNDHISHDVADWYDQDRVQYRYNNAFICIKAPAL